MNILNSEEGCRILIKDWELSGLKPSKFCKDHNLELRTCLKSFKE